MKRMTDSQADRILEFMEGTKEETPLWEYIPTVEEIERANVKENFDQYAVYLLYLITVLKNAPTDDIDEEEFENRKQTKKYILNLLADNLAED